MTRPTILFNLDDSQTTYVVDLMDQELSVQLPYTIGDDIGGTVPQVAPSYGIIHRMDDGQRFYRETLDGELIMLYAPQAGTNARLMYADDSNAVFDVDNGTFVNVSPNTGAPIWNVPWPSGNGFDSVAFKVGASIVGKSNQGGAFVRVVLADGTASVIPVTTNMETISGNGSIVVDVGSWNTPGTPNVVVIDGTFTPSYREVPALDGTQGFCGSYDAGYGDYMVYTNDYITFVTYDIVDNVVQTFDLTPHIPADAVTYGWSRYEALPVGNKLVMYAGAHNTATAVDVTINTMYVVDMPSNTFDDSFVLNMPLDGNQEDDYDYDVDRIIARELPTWSITGNITSGGSPVSTNVHLLGYNMKRLSTRVSNGTTGDYTFRVYRNTPMTVVAEHPTSGNALIASAVVPVAE